MAHQAIRNFDEYDSLDHSAGPYFLPRQDADNEYGDYGDGDPIEDSPASRRQRLDESLAMLRTGNPAELQYLQGQYGPQFFGNEDSEEDEDFSGESGDESGDEPSSFEDAGLIDPNLTLGDLAKSALNDVSNQTVTGSSNELSGKPNLPRGRDVLHRREMAPVKGSRAEVRTRGARRGPRKPMEPSQEFKALESQALAAYVEQDYETAQDLAEEAIQNNPEMFSAWALLSQIYEAQNDSLRASAVLFSGAHSRPKDPGVWLQAAESLLSLANPGPNVLDNVDYCYNRVIQADKTNVEARERRAFLSTEMGEWRRAAARYRKLLNMFPHKLVYLRALAEASFQQKMPLQGIRYYDEAFAYHQTQDPGHRMESLLWSDANIYAELHLLAGELTGLADAYRDGLDRTKRLARWIQGRGHEDVWDQCTENDCEFDNDASLRRTAFLEANGVEASVNAESLPLELRVKLGTFRLELGDYVEAMTQFSWLLRDGDSSYEYSDLLLSVASSLEAKSFYQEALDFYVPIRDMEDIADRALFISIANCFRRTQDYASAEQYYRDLMSVDDTDVEGPKHLFNMLTDLGRFEDATLVRDEIVSREKKRRALDQSILDSAADPDAPVASIEAFDDYFIFKTSKADRPATTKPRTQVRKRLDQKALLKEDYSPSFYEMDHLKSRVRAGDREGRDRWMSLAADAVEHFRAYKGFWPSDKAHRFLGYSAEDRRRAQQLNDKQNTEEIHESNGELPTTYCNVVFSDWLDCLLQYAMLLVETNDHQNAYEICKVTADCSLWYYEKDCQFTIYLVWCLCSVMVEDHDTLTLIGRFFIRQNELATDGYRLYGALNRLCTFPNVSFFKGPVQKWAMRQVKSMDKLVVKNKQATATAQPTRSPSASTKQDETTNIAQTDVALLVMYGHMLYASGSFKNSIHYFYRAHAADPENPMILLSLALAHIHHSLKRQSENRQRLIVQGVTFLSKYYDVRKATKNPLLQQEAEFNVARTYHLLGLLHLSIPYYEHCLELSEGVQQLPKELEKHQDFAVEAAYMLRGIYMQNGSSKAACKITERWLQL